MGVVRPPWISKEWFSKCPYNYCDHFGNKILLASICRVCKDDVQREKLYKKAGKDPYDTKNVFKDILDSFIQLRKMLEKDAKRLGIDLNNLTEEYREELPSPEINPIYRLVKKYGNQVEKLINDLQVIPVTADLALIGKIIDVLTHSRYFAIVKINRALSSRFEEEKDSQDELEDSKTSAFFAYVAIVRNSKALMALAKHKPLRELKEKHLKFASVSIDVAEMIQEEFFPDEKLVYKEFGVEEF